MSAERRDANDLRDRVTDFLSRNFPQIQMHGGTAVIESLNAESGEITLRLAGACSGCGISPMTVQAIKSRMASEIPEIETVYADTVDDQPADAAGPQGSAEESSEPPF